MGAVETMEDFFEKLNAGEREAAVALMDEKTEMRVHVGDSVQTLRGVERVGGWFLRGEKGLRMIPGEIRDTGNTWEADLLVVRPGAQSQHIDATFRVEAGKITAINIAPALARARRRARTSSLRRGSMPDGTAGRRRRGRQRDDDLLAERDLVRVLDGPGWRPGCSSSVTPNFLAILHRVSPAS